MSAAMKPSEALRKARELITPEGAWTRNAYARTSQGIPTDVHYDDAVCWCSLGALQRVSRGYSIYNVLGENFIEKITAPLSVGSFNDEKSHDAVLDAFDRAAALAEVEGR